MSIRRVSQDELKGISEKLFEPVVSDLRVEIDALRSDQARQHQTIIALHAQLKAVEHRVTSEFQRSQKSREAILKRLAEMENLVSAARAVS